MKTLGMLPLESIRPNSWNVNVIAGSEFAKLKEAMKASGPEKTEPVMVRRAEDGSWELVDGEQRWRAAKELGWKALPAVEVDVDRREAKFLCLSFNALRGTVDVVKLSELLLADQEMFEAAARVYGREKAEEFRESARKLTKEAKKVLSEGVKSGVTVTLEKVRAIAETPPDIQELAATAATKTREMEAEFIRSMVEPFILPQEEGQDAGPAEGRRREGGQKKARQHSGYVIGGRAYEVASFVEITKPGTYVVYFDAENRKVGVKEHHVDFNTYVDKFTGPQLYEFSFKCRHGATYVVKFDASSGEYSIEEKAA